MHRVPIAPQEIGNFLIHVTRFIFHDKHALFERLHKALSLTISCGMIWRVITLLFTMCAKGILTNCDPLSLTSCLQKPLCAKTDLMTLMVFSDVIDFIIKTSGHLEFASIMTKNILFINGPRKSTCTHSHGEVGHSHGCKTLPPVHFSCF